MGYKLGADPEVFAYDDTKKDHISGHDLIPGTKWEPHKIKYGAVQVDGLALEFNIDPASNRKEFARNINKVSDTLRNMVRKVKKDIELSYRPTVYFPQYYFDSLPDEVKVLGCNPDYNAYTGKENPVPTTDKPMRTASGHIHIGWAPDNVKFKVDNDDHFEMCRKIVRQLDAVLYPVSLIFDKDKERRTLYGAPGAFRPKPYGVEYRVLSNSWCRWQDTIHWVWDATMWALNQMEKGNVKTLTNLKFDWLDVLHYYSKLVDEGMPPISKAFIKNYFSEGKVNA